ncbi:right-handed parallel beta-helix repeat-containing protein [Arthrobacter sp. MMS18-M83]|uniref:right-handed parallel beta-helix repeat-containing protein n=1 Tax=Arthrobacter sp. MMS18-M83 TaxID=2996261 RepID=UPI00227A1226|nr:right-handed parallel beta-helix repeat-containing protein [Arthrobacter sp. MMS18-M83]WAH97264.1 right-handed parallel beta-helix repeat-containing protein [Arthrobacter sp. MMS18-M83]
MSPPRGRTRLAAWGLAGAMIIAFLLVGLLSMSLRHPVFTYRSGAGPTPDGQSAFPSSGVTTSAAAGDPTASAEQEPGAAPMSAAALSARAGQGPVPASTAQDCPGATTTVRNKDQLSAALGGANPGDVISVADGIYTGNFTADRPGTLERRIFLCGGPGAVLDGGNTDTGYVLHLDHADYWVISGLTIRNGQKGIVTDTVKGAVLQQLTVTGVGQEGIHLRRNSTGNLLLANTVNNTGRVTPEYGEGIYVGTAVGNWCALTGCRPDESNFNVIARNSISETTAENIDIKEGTIGGVISGNTFSGSAMTAADAWVNVKGNAWTIEGNTGAESPRDGFQTHNILLGWGDHNLFRNNTATITGRGQQSRPRLR